MEIRKGTARELDELAALYNAVCDALAAGTNYPGWHRGTYPTREDAERGVAAGELYVAVEQGAIVGTMILRQGQEPGYRTARWGRELTDGEVLTVYTFAVHPGHAGKGVGAAMLAFAERLAAAQGKKALRLDVYEKNTPAMRLYEKCGFRYIATVDLGYSNHGLKWFKLYEKLLDGGMPKRQEA